MKRTFSLIAAFLVFSQCAHAEPPPAQKDTISIGKLRFGINDQELLIEQSVQKEQGLLSELARLSRETLEHQRKVDELKGKISEQQRILASKEQEMVSLMHQNEALRNNLIKRLKAYYVMGRNGFFTITFSGKTLPELLLSQDAFSYLVTYDQDLFKEYRESITEIRRTTAAKALEKTMLEKFLADADQENEALQKTANEKNDLLQRVQAQKGLYQLALKEMRRAERELAASIQSNERPNPTHPRGTFLENKGQLPPPLWGKVIRRFQQQDEDGDTTFTNGVTIKAPAQSEVYSIFSGTILFAGPMRGYGNMIIVDHHQHYYSVSARLDQLRVRAGENIAQGQIIGTTDEGSNRPGGEFYFEIRRDAVAEDPLNWLSSGSLDLR
ncbi:MAG: peptidoglycan DD-metalloendopeptidase family protein [Desulfobulbus sp.]|nr:peptidoglycan DD-metalloendopeptidase family protein [Desulfobulbus sp.]